MRLIYLSSLALGLWAAHPAAALDAARACDAAASRAEREQGVPSGVLAAVGVVESGRSNGSLGTAPWPWTINAAGQGSHYASKADAVAAVLGLMAKGYPLIDVGCFQIDILYHAGIFRSLDEAFDPDRNAQEAARILVTERERGMNWATAVAHYHSANPAFGMPYLERVRAALPASRMRANTADLDTSLFLISRQSPGVVIKMPTATTVPLPRVVYALPIATTIRAVRARPILTAGARPRPQGAPE